MLTTWRGLVSNSTQLKITWPIARTPMNFVRHDAHAMAEFFKFRPPDGGQRATSMLWFD